MLKLNLTDVFKARNIAKPYSYLVKAGLSPNLATRLANNQVDSILFRHLELLCLHLNCEPNDLFSWVPDSKIAVSENHSLNKLKKKADADNLNLMAQLSYKQLLKLSEKIEEIKKETEV
ncbi:MAG: helix-turn-helix transcriptional regulator [Paludibacteraceae bacterium]